MDIFSSEEFPVHMQVEASVRFRSDFAQLIPLSRRGNPGFKLVNKIYYFGDMIVGYEQRDPCIHVRTAREINERAMNAFFFIVMRKGYAKMEERAGPGQIQIVDSRQPFIRQSTSIDQTAVILTPEMFGDRASMIESMHGKILKAPLAGLLADYVNSLASRASSIPKCEWQAAVNATKSLIEACLFPGVRSSVGAEEVIAEQRIVLAKRYIEENLLNKALSVEHLVNHLSLSRRQIYRLFEPYGGVANYIKSQRLAFARDRLADPTERRLIKEIAYDSGFPNATEFSRCFKKSFGYTPQEVRDMPIERRRMRLRYSS